MQASQLCRQYEMHKWAIFFNPNDRDFYQEMVVTTNLSLGKFLKTLLRKQFSTFFKVGQSCIMQLLKSKLLIFKPNPKKYHMHFFRLHQ